MVPCYHLKGRFGQQLSFVEVSSLCQGLANRIGINRIVNRPPPGVPCCGSGFHGFQMRFSQERCYPRLYVACSRQLAIYAHGSTQWGLRDLNHAHSYRTNETGFPGLPSVRHCAGQSDLGYDRVPSPVGESPLFSPSSNARFLRRTFRSTSAPQCLHKPFLRAHSTQMTSQFVLLL